MRLFVKVLFVGMFFLFLIISSGDVCREGIYFERLFPLSWYGQAMEICMRVLTDSKHEYDQVTASDLCLGRLVRLSHTVKRMEYMHRTKKLYPYEDIAYMLALVSVVAKARQYELRANTVASSIVVAIKSRLALLLRYY